MNARCTVISNNPLVLERFPDAVRIDGSVRDLFLSVRRLLLEGKAVLHAHPVAGNLRLLRNPYRSVILEEATPRMVAGRASRDMRIIDDVLERLGTLEEGAIPEKDLPDYGIVDLDLLVSAFCKE
jgi:hypothetical protein